MILAISVTAQKCSNQMRRNCYADKAFTTFALTNTSTGSLW
jgi:hypothetical protein